MHRSNVFRSNDDLLCSHCGESLFENFQNATILIVTDEENSIVAVKPCCKEACLAELKSEFHGDNVSGQIQLSAFVNPYIFLKHIFFVFDGMRGRRLFASNEAFEEYKSLVKKCYPFVSRDLTAEELLSQGF